MRNYWVRIALGALVIFTVGMVARALINRGIGGVRGVVEGSGPLSIPLAFIPFRLGGDKLGTLERVTFERTAPQSVSSVRLEVKLSDSLLARGLEGCRLAANLDSKDGHRRLSGSTFWCAPAGSDTALVEYGQAVFRPGEVSVPLYLPQDLIDELQDLDFDGDSTPISEAEIDSLEASTELSVDSAPVLRARMGDSLRAEGMRRADSAKGVPSRMADSTRSR